jgi:hypothetical protein
MCHWLREGDILGSSRPWRGGARIYLSASLTFLIFVFVFETGSHYIAQMASNLFFCLSLSSAGITGVKDQAWLPIVLPMSAASLPWDLAQPLRV